MDDEEFDEAMMDAIDSMVQQHESSKAQQQQVLTAWLHAR